MRNELNLPQDNFAICIDSTFVDPATALLTSIAANHKGKSNIALLHADLSNADVRKLKIAARPHLVVPVHVENALLPAALSPDHLPPAAYFRLLLADFLETEKVLYLDADVIVQRDLRRIFDHKFNNPIAAVRDQLVLALPRLARTERLENDLAYFNSGVMLIDLTAWQKEQITSQCLDLLRKHRFRYGDQDALNHVLAGNWSELPATYNAQTAGYVYPNMSPLMRVIKFLKFAVFPHVVHFTGPKPWIAESNAPRRWIYLKYERIAKRIRDRKSV